MSAAAAPHAQPEAATEPATGTTGVVAVAPEHHGLLAAFHRRAWDPAATAEGVRAARRAAAAANPVEPGREPPTFLFLADGAPVGHVTTLPVRLWAGGERRAHWLKGLMVLPEHRNGPVGFLLLRAAAAAVGTDLLSAAVAPAARRLLEAAGLATVGALPDAVRLLRPGRVLRRLDPALLGPGRAASLARIAGRAPLLGSTAGLAAGAALGGWTRAAGRTGGLHALVLPEPDAAALSALWERARGGIGAAAVRDGPALLARYRDGGGYRLLGVFERGVLAGFAAVRPPRPEGDPRLHGIRVATLSELVAEPHRGDVLRALVAGAEVVAASLDADALLCGASHPAARRALRRRAFVPLGGRVHLLARPAPGAAPLPPTPESWWLTRGDSHADEVF